MALAVSGASHTLNKGQIDAFSLNLSLNDNNSNFSDANWPKSAIIKQELYDKEHPSIVDEGYPSSPHTSEYFQGATGSQDPSPSSICGIHWRLEVLEQRIQNGDDTEHEHPIQALLLERTEGVRNITREEFALKDGYIKSSEFNKIPSFWARRPWDNTSDLLSAAESDQLKKKIDSCYDLANRSKKRNNKPIIIEANHQISQHVKQSLTKTTRARVTPRLFKVTLNSRIFVTDDSEDFTDIENW